MTWVKICGMDSVAAIEAAVETGADAIGLVLAEDSPRHLTIERAADLARDVPIATFIVTVDMIPGEALEAAEHVGATGIQAHGYRAFDVAAEAVDAGYLSLAPVPIGEDGALTDIDEVPTASLPLFDTASASQHGGTGRTFDWSFVVDPGRPFVLAGGLGPDNVAGAIETVRPFGVDASSRLESRPGVKDPSRIIAFIEEAKKL